MSFLQTRFFLLFFLAQLALSASAQDTLTFLNGRSMTVTDAKDASGNVEYTGFYRRGKLITKPGSLERYRIYSIDYSGGERSILYAQDSSLGNFRTQQEMGYYVQGQSHAHEYHKARWAFWTSLGVTTVASIFDTYRFDDAETPNINEAGFFKSEPTILQVLLPFAVTMSIGLPRVSLKSSTVSDRALLNDQNFLLGYARIGRQKKFFQALKGSGIGIGVGLLSYLIFKP